MSYDAERNARRVGAGMSPVRLAIPLPGPLVWTRRERRNDSVGLGQLIAWALLLPLIAVAVAVGATLVVLYGFSKGLVYMFDELLFIVGDACEEHERKKSARARCREETR